MPLALPLALRLEANKLVATRPWLLLVEITLPDAAGGSVLRFARNTEDITYSAQTWTAFPFTVGDRGESGDGTVQAVTIRVSNVARSLTAYVEAASGLVGAAVRLIVVHEANLAENYSALTMSYTIMSAHIDDTWIEFRLGAESPMRRRFPIYRANPLHCNWVANFRGVECKYVGADTTCGGSLTDCAAKSNSANFGGRPGITGAPRFV